MPADAVSTTTDGTLIYEIPDCAASWMRSSPEAHNAYVREVNEKLNGKVKPLVRFVKAWKYYRSVPISSFYLELQVTKYAAEEASIIYSIDLDRLFSFLRTSKLAPIEDPLGISGAISACSSDSQLEDAESKLLTAHVHAELAREAERKGDIPSAFYYWNRLYNGRFPSYS